MTPNQGSAHWVRFLFSFTPTDLIIVGDLIIGVGEPCSKPYMRHFVTQMKTGPFHLYLMPLMDMAVKFHSWIPFCNRRKSLCCYFIMKLLQKLGLV